MEQHDYRILHKGYYKAGGGKSALGPTYNQQVEYTTLYCPHCGDVKEVVSADNRKPNHP